VNSRHQFTIITYIALVAMTITGALAHGPDDGHDHPPVRLGPAEPAAPPGHISPISAGLIDVAIQQTDEEFKEEIARHTHAHTHHDFEKRITRLEVRINEVIELCNKMMPMLLGNVQQSMDATAIAQGAGAKVKKLERKVTDLESKVRALIRKLEKSQ
jgi:uncharacterized protein YceH (UPF0502 family)